MMAVRYIGSIVVACGLLGACTETKQDPELSTYRANIVVEGVPNGAHTGIPNGGVRFLPNGAIFLPNGIMLPNAGSLLPNGIPLPNGGSLSSNGTGWYWVQGTGFPQSVCRTADGRDVTGLSFEGSLLKGFVGPNKASISGAEFVGVSCQMPSSIPSISISLTFESIGLDSSYSDTKDIWAYTISAKTSDGGSWPSVCIDEKGTATAMVPLVGSGWDLTSGNRIDNQNIMTMGCSFGAIGKCARIGYRPWANGTICKGWERDRDKKKEQCEQVNLKAHHQACTRMVRADYCGDGTPHTLNGTIISVMDYLKPVILLDEDKWQIEARWQESGAICLTEARHPELFTDGGCKDKNGKIQKFKKCEPYEVSRGLMVSAFAEANTKTGK